MFAPPPTLLVRLPAATSAPAAARRAVRQVLTERHADQFTDDALLMTSEIVSNATAVGGGCELSVWYIPDAIEPDEGSLRVEVFDTNPDMPTMAAVHEPMRIGGRGLQIVDQLATLWGVRPRDGGKSVWFEMYSNLRTH